MLFRKIVFASSWFILHQASAGPAGTIVTGDSNPNLAGRDDGYACCGGDSAPAQSPALVTELAIESCAAVTILASGKVSFTPGAPTGNNPDGDSAFSMTNYGDGISAPLNVRANALLGVFLSDGSPTGTNTPASLDFASGLDFASLSPEIGQIFFIGDGLDTDTNAGVYDGAPQDFIASPGATRLFLGTGDGTGWFNNSGSFTVSTSSTPEQRERACGDAASPAGLTATDALLVLRSAVGAALCQECVCDVDRSGSVVAGDALTLLRHVVGQDVEISCGCCPFLE